MFCWLTVYLFFSFLISPLPKETPFYGATVKIHEPVGVIGIACPDTCPLLAFVSLLAPAVIRGNTVVIVPSQKHPMIAVDMYQVPIMSILFWVILCIGTVFWTLTTEFQIFLCFPMIIIVFFFNYETIK